MEHDARLVYVSDPGARKSASGGAFYAIAKGFLEAETQPVVYGCGWDENHVARHIPVFSLQELPRLQGSKYVQSQMGDTFRQIARALEQGKAVLFSGTPCQVAGLKKYLGKPWQKLYTVEIVCHGVPSPGFLESYLAYLQELYGGKIENLSFRNPGPTDRHGYVLQFTVGGRQYRRFAREDPYYSAFLESHSLRPSCYGCLFPGKQRQGDILLGDSNHQGFHPTRAISLVQVLSPKGARLLQQAKMWEDFVVSLALEAADNRQLLSPAHRPEARQEFYHRLHREGVSALTPRVSRLRKLKTRIKYRLPTRWKQAVKRMIKP